MTARVVVLAALLALVSCGGRAAQSPGSEGGPPFGAGNPCLPVTALELQALEHGEEWEPIAALRADGALVRRADAQEKVLARLGDDTMSGADGAPVLACGADGWLYEHGQKTDSHFSADGGLLLDRDRMLVRVGDDGAVQMMRDGKLGRDLHARVVGDVPHARRTAALLVLFAMLGGES